MREAGSILPIALPLVVNNVTGIITALSWVKNQVVDPNTSYVAQMATRIDAGTVGLTIRPSLDLIVGSGIGGP